ncbi:MULTISPECIES: HupE/UreJ family protein [unclassified Ruegeria]|uniref:HupE/UreJ family protein n=1 Tax=unclassified Ruegeria TaxID=2625375 RepID=UPI001ADC69E9|nr:MULTISPECIES: HupE/UreJ family protein [unclassified Ruegeria]MBO9410985.1 HupE/UreJ family protein [Ruegeria sp. R8_1]MBO9415186.1 HupE/UreJ family protein [Ruegeria sp. R8_2]
MGKGLLPVCVLLVLAAGPAAAHSPVPGIKGFYVGLVHPFSTPPQALLMLSLGLLVGGFKPERVRWLLPSFLAASFAGLISAYGLESLDAKMFSIAFAACSTAALFQGKLLPVAIALVCIGAFLIGDASVPEAGPVRDRVFTMSGSMVGANVGFLYLLGGSLWIRERFSKPWVAIAFRVAAAWLGAVSLLMLALRLSETASPG